MAAYFTVPWNVIYKQILDIIAQERKYILWSIKYRISFSLKWMYSEVCYPRCVFKL